MDKVVLSPIPLEELKEGIREIVKQELSKLVFPQSKIVETYFTRQEVSDYLQVSLPTLHQWAKDGTLKGYRIGTRIRYKRSDVEQALNEIKARNY